MVQVQASGIIKVPRNQIWPFVTAPENFAKYIDSYEEGEFLSPNKTGIGATFRWYTKFLGRRIESTESIIKWIDNERVEYEGKMAGARFHSQMILNDSQSDIEFTIIIDYKIPCSLLGKILDVLYFKRRIKKNISRSILAVKNFFEVNSAPNS